MTNKIAIIREEDIEERRVDKYKNPRVFTEQGVLMISSILKSDTAIEVNIKITDAFVTTKTLKRLIKIKL